MKNIIELNSRKAHLEWLIILPDFPEEAYKKHEEELRQINECLKQRRYFAKYLSAIDSHHLLHTHLPR
jgi:hypothetical protein